MKSYNLDRCARQGSVLRTSYYSNYKHATTADEIQEIRKVYEDETGRSWDLRSSCGTCVLKLYRAVGEMYFKELERIEKELEPDENKVAEVEVKPKAVTKKKDDGKGKGKKTKCKGISIVGR